jgi:hypothetical protein
LFLKPLPSPKNSFLTQWIRTIQLDEWYRRLKGPQSDLHVAPPVHEVANVANEISEIVTGTLKLIDDIFERFCHGSGD